MKALFVATVVKTHINVFHLPYIKMFKNSGWETAVCARNDFPKKEDCVIPNCDKFYDLPFERNPFKLNNIKVLKKLLSLIKKEKYDIIHCHTPTGGVLARLVALFAGNKNTKVIYTAHGFHFYKGAPKKNWLLYYPVEWFCSFFTDTLITINKEDFEFAKRHMHAKEILYVPGVGVDTEKFKNVNCDKIEKRKELNIPENATVLLSVGELIVRKNHEIIIKALKEIDNPDIHYLIVGAGEIEDYLKKLTQENCLDKNVHFLGYRKDICEICKAADIFCFPSLQEGLPVALMEAMSVGMPVICSEIRGNTDLIENDKGGYLCKATDFSAFAERIMSLARDKTKRENMSEVNLKNVKMFDIENVKNLMRKIYGV